MFDRSNSLGAGEVQAIMRKWPVCLSIIGRVTNRLDLPGQSRRLLVPDGHMLTLAADLPTQLSNGTASNERAAFALILEGDV